jgi:arylsulfatase A-like enzyme/Tfp pilus assembly protein PilF
LGQRQRIFSCGSPARPRWWHRRGLGCGLLLAAVVALAACDSEREGVETQPAPSAVEPEGWNVVLITLDTVRPDALGAYGQARGATPNLDRVAAEGVVFDAAVSSSPSTLPSHASIFTGKHPYAHGTRANIGYLLHSNEETLAERLTAAGYRTAAEVSAMVMRKETRIAQGFESVRDPKSTDVVLKAGRRRVDREVIELPIRVATDIGRRGREFIRENRDRRFFLWLHFFDAHQPLSPPPPFSTTYRDDSYLAAVAYVDAEIGRLVKAIEGLGLRGRTLVVVTADHGEGHGEHGETRHSYFIYDSTMRVPLILWGPDAIPAGTRIGSVVRSIDIAPTILDLLDQPPFDGIQGVSLRPLLVGEATDMELTGYGESLELHGTFGIAPLRFVREGRWKYIHKVNPELYDIEADPHELSNLAQRETARVAQLQAQLRTLLTGSGPSADATIEMDAETRANLAALGYAAATSGPTIADELESLQLVGDDAATKIGAVESLSIAESFLQSQEFDRAHAALSGLLEDDPESTYLLGMTGLSLMRLERFGEALAHLEQAVEQDPENRDFLRLLVMAFEREGRDDDAARGRWRLLEIDPCLDAREKLYLYLQQRGDYAEQFRVFEEGAQRCPESAANLINYAWVLATVPVDELRDGERAVTTAKRGIALLDGRPGPAYLDTLAAAHAEAGDFARAIQLEREALQLLESGAAPEAVLAEFREHLAEFEAGRAIRDH